MGGCGSIAATGPLSYIKSRPAQRFVSCYVYCCSVLSRIASVINLSSVANTGRAASLAHPLPRARCSSRLSCRGETRRFVGKFTADQRPTLLSLRRPGVDDRFAPVARAGLERSRSWSGACQTRSLARPCATRAAYSDVGDELYDSRHLLGRAADPTESSGPCAPQSLGFSSPFYSRCHSCPSRRRSVLSSWPKGSVL